MKLNYLLPALVFLNSILSHGQQFTRIGELPTTLSNPWEMTLDKDGNYLWLTESGGRVSRVSLASSNYGEKTIIYTAPDYFDGDPSEKLNTCFNPKIGSGTLGLALHPNFGKLGTSFIYFVYSYNAGTSLSPQTKFKIAELTYDFTTQKVTAAKDLVSYNSGYEHLGGRLIIANNYLYLSVGDYGPSEITAPTCYLPQTNNPNNNTQAVNTINGKIHRFNLDGSIPSDNPIPGNSLFTRGHRNPQGLMYNKSKNILYDVEHGDITDDEINILLPGMNYGWKNVRGYHDGNYTGETDYINSYVPNPAIANDKLMPPLFTWCDTKLPTDSNNFFGYCTVAPSDGLFYDKTAIPEWNNSLLITTLKNGDSTDQQVFQFKLTDDGKGLIPSTPTNPNPKKFFGEDQKLNGRLRDIEVSNDGKDVYLLTNDFTLPHKIVKYSYIEPSGLNDEPQISSTIYISPNPASDFITIQSIEQIESIEMLSSYNTIIVLDKSKLPTLDISNLSNGIYILNIKLKNGKSESKKIVKL